MADAAGTILSLLVTVAVPIAIILVLLRARRRSAALGREGESAAALVGDGEGGLVVPVRRLVDTASLLGTQSTLSPKLWITSVGLRFKVIRKVREIGFDELREVHVSVPAVAGGVRLFFRLPHWSGLPLPGYGLIADVFDIPTARAALCALPASVSLTERASRLRNGAVDAAIGRS